MKKITLLPAALLALALTFTGCNNPKTSEDPTPPDYKFAVIADLHLFDMDNIPHAGYWWNYRSQFDSKNYAHCKKLMQTIVDRFKEENVKYVIIPGDLTKDSEIINHYFAASFFKQMEENGAQVFVINGNHDLNDKGGVAYVQVGAQPDENADKKIDLAWAKSTDFLDIYKDYGYDKALSRAPDDLSYSANMGDQFRLILIDTNKYDDAEPKDAAAEGEVRDTTLTWAKGECAKAIQDGRIPIGVLHHALLEHVPDCEGTYLKEYMAGNNYENVRNELAAAGMHIAFTGHFHAQSAVVEKIAGQDFYDIQTGSVVSFCPVRFGQVYSKSRQIKMTTWIVDLPGELVEYGPDKQKIPFRQFTDKSQKDGLAFENYYLGLYYDLYKLGQGGVSLNDANRLMNDLLDKSKHSPDGKSTVMEVLSDAYIAYYKGQEKKTPAVDSIYQKLIDYKNEYEAAGENAMVDYMEKISTIYRQLYTDAPKGNTGGNDNTITIKYQLNLHSANIPLG